MAIIKSSQPNTIKDSYNILVDLESLCSIPDLKNNKIYIKPCRLKAINSLFDEGHKITIFTSIKEEYREEILPQLIDLKFNDIKFNFILDEVDFIVSSKSREQVPFFNEVFDRDYTIKPLPYVVTYNYY